MGNPAEVLKAMAAIKGIFAINLMADNSLYIGSLMSRVLCMKELRAPTTEHMIAMGWESTVKPL